MDLLKKVELYLNAKTRSALPRRGRQSPLDKQEEELLAEIRKALGDVEAKERELAKRIKVEQSEAKGAARRGDRAEQRAHERRAAELEYYLEQESIQAINLEEKLAALEEKLALAKDAVETEARKTAVRDEQASKELAQGMSASNASSAGREADLTSEEEITVDDFADDDPDTAAKKSRLSG